MKDEEGSGLYSCYRQSLIGPQNALRLKILPEGRRAYPFSDIFPISLLGETSPGSKMTQDLVSAKPVRDWSLSQSGSVTAPLPLSRML